MSHRLAAVPQRRTHALRMLFAIPMKRRRRQRQGAPLLCAREANMPFKISVLHTFVPIKPSNRFASACISSNPATVAAAPRATRYATLAAPSTASSLSWLNLIASATAARSSPRTLQCRVSSSARSENRSPSGAMRITAPFRFDPSGRTIRPVASGVALPSARASITRCVPDPNPRSPLSGDASFARHAATAASAHWVLLGGAPPAPTTASASESESSVSSV